MSAIYTQIERHLKRSKRLFSANPWFCIRRGAYMGKAGRQIARKMLNCKLGQEGGDKHEAIQGAASRNTKHSTST
jgi:hypothetical protein